MTGATGFLGGVLAQQLRDAGHDVVALVRQRGKAAALERQGVVLVDGDLDDTAALDRLLEGADGFFHVAGWYKHGRRERETLRRVNVAGTRNALAAAERAGVRTVYTSTVAINSDTGGAVRDESYHHRGPWVCEYDRTKWEAHQVFKEYAAAGAPVLAVMPSVIYGPGDTGSGLGQMTRRIIAGKPLLGPRVGGCGWAHVEDVAAGHLLAMSQGRVGESYILAGENRPYGEVFEIIRQAAGSKSRVFLAPPRMVRAMTALNGPVELLSWFPQYLTAEAARAGLGTYYADAGKARTELGWTSRPLAEGMRQTVEAELGRAA